MGRSIRSKRLQRNKRGQLAVMRGVINKQQSEIAVACDATTSSSYSALADPNPISRKRKSPFGEVYTVNTVIPSAVSTPAAALNKDKDLEEDEEDEEPENAVEYVDSDSSDAEAADADERPNRRSNSTSNKKGRSVSRGRVLPERKKPKKSRPAPATSKRFEHYGQPEEKRARTSS
eukprot:TRINITY_DN165_c0_g1_i1.p1 TRINITY_DN165_c0_g1~~TRINITY_DN165_c0_g1_i1.p1  ORF type:complete len:176 (+),score=34.24 TRINITY_DN165_c0_g1_i1:61-588(+)